jgi:uncharacterized SAM-binding protein YcdF (DUF218 family)
MLDWIRYFVFFGQVAGLLWGLLVLGTLFLVWRRKWLGALVLGAIASVTFLIGGTPLPARLIANLEAPYVRPNLAALPPADAVLILGGGHRPSPHDAFGLDLVDGADRFITGLELLRLNKGRVLVLGGGAYTQNHQVRTYGELIRNWLNTWGLVKVPIFTLGTSPTTRAEALAYQRLAKTNGWRSTILVTSAFHCRRAEAVFHNTGIRVLAVGCDYRGLGSYEPEGRLLCIPRRERFEQMDLYLHEMIGFWIYSSRGWTVDNTPPLGRIGKASGPSP